MDFVKVEKLLKVKRLVSAVFVILFLVQLIITVLFIFIGFRVFWLISLGLLVILFLLIIPHYYIYRCLQRETRLMKFFCPKCEAYAFRLGDRPNCLQCNTVMYPVRYCSKCRHSDIVVSLNQWRCDRCGGKLKKITSSIQKEQELMK